MLTKGSVTIGLETRFGPNWPGVRCGARTKAGGECKRPAVKRTGRCTRHGGKSTGATTQSAERACGYVIDNCGNKPLAGYTRQDALVFRNWLVVRGLTGSSVTRNFSYVKAVINFALSEFALDIRNPSVSVYHDRSKGVVSLKAIPLDDLRRVQRECMRIDDDIR